MQYNNGVIEAIKAAPKLTFAYPAMPTSIIKKGETYKNDAS